MSGRPPLRDLDAVIDGYSGLARKALDYAQITGRLVGKAKQPGFTVADWAPLAELVDTARFERIGNFKEVMTWDEYVGFLTGWATTSDWECSFRRVTEGNGMAVLELEERSAVGGVSNAVNSVSVYEFDDAGRIVHIDVYLQMPLPDPAMLQSYAGIEITG